MAHAVADTSIMSFNVDRVCDNLDVLDMMSLS